MSARCYYCGHGATSTSAMVLDDDGYLHHEWHSKDDDAPSPCPPLRDGWEHCHRCDGAYPLGRLFLAQEEATVVTDPKTGRLSWKFQCLAPLSDETPRWWMRYEAFPCDHVQTKQLGYYVGVDPPPNAKGGIFEHDHVGRPYLVCRTCSSGWPERARRRATKAGDTAADSQARADEALEVFKSGRATNVASLAVALNVSVDRARKQVQRLKREGLVEVTQGGQRGRPEQLRAAGDDWLLPG